MNHLDNNRREARCIEFMRPEQVRKIIDTSGIVFIPVSPRFEWHGPHLPLATDGIIAEEAAKAMAERLKACYFRCLPIGLDETRSVKTKEKWGLRAEDVVFGMNFPELELQSEYNEIEEMKKMLGSRLKAMENSGFRAAIIVNHHGGVGQNPTLRKIAEEWTSEKFAVLYSTVASHNSWHPPKPKDFYLRVGGHAGMSETHQLMGSHPGLADLSALPEGELKVNEQGILHHSSVIPAELNPRHAEQEIADKWRESVYENMENKLRRMLTDAGVWYCQKFNEKYESEERKKENER